MCVFCLENLDKAFLSDENLSAPPLLLCFNKYLPIKIVRIVTTILSFISKVFTIDLTYCEHLSLNCKNLK
jgi:hypothetical protein